MCTSALGLSNVTGLDLIRVKIGRYRVLTDVGTAAEERGKGNPRVSAPRRHASAFNRALRSWQCERSDPHVTRQCVTIDSAHNSTFRHRE